MIAKLRGWRDCRHCQQPLEKGEMIWPTEQGWVHHQCALDEAEANGTRLHRPLCKHFSRGSCRQGSSCFYAHEAREVANALFVEEGKRLFGATTPTKSRKNSENRRATAVRKFLLLTFGRETLNEGSGCLDIAGGKGELSFELVRFNGVKSTVIDPRPLDVSKFEERLQKGIYFHDQKFGDHLDVPMAELTKPTTNTEIDHLRIMFELQRRDRKQANALLPRALLSAGEFSSAMKWVNQCDWTVNALKEHSPEFDTDVSSQDLDIEIVRQYEDAVRKVLGCSVLVGLHADAAVEPIMDFAIAHEKPFAVVPCCVFWKKFHWRRILKHNDSAGMAVQVRTYEQFLTYLMAKDVSGKMGIEIAELPFKGKNKVIFSRGVSRNRSCDSSNNNSAGGAAI